MVKLGVREKNLKITALRMVFWKFTPNLTITRCKFGSNFEVFWNFFKKPLKVPSLARSVPKPLKVPSLARSVPKPLNVPSLARSVQKPLKVPSLARSVPKPLKMGQAQACERGEGGEPVHPSRCGSSLFRSSLPTSYSPSCESEVSEWSEWVSEVK